MENPVTLEQLVNQVISSLKPLAVDRKSLFVNHISEELKVCTDRELLAMVFGNVLETAVSYTNNDCIRISADKFEDSIHINVKQHSQHAYTTIACSMKHIQPLAEKLGGCVIVNSTPSSGINVALSFYNSSLTLNN